MSSKQAKKQFVMPRLPPDLIVTRHRAQKQMRSTKKDKATTSMTVPIKSDVSLLKKNHKKVIKKVTCTELAAEQEYHPNKLKRNLTAKKIVLEPKHDMKFVAGTNKRKRRTPQKDIASVEYPDQLTHPQCDSELSMCEAVRLTDETRSLTDEDLMEILTCPSPVWWEDPPYADYIEDAILRLPGEKTVKANQVDSQPHTQTSPDSQPHTQTSPDSQPHTQTSSDSQPHTHTSSDSQPHTQTSSDSQPHTQTSSDSQPHTHTSSDSQPHTQTSSDSQPHTQTSSDSHPHTQTSSDSQPHTQISSDSHPHTQTSSDSQPYTQRFPDSHPHTQTSPESQPYTQTFSDTHIDFEQEINQFKIITDKFKQKKTKLEHVLDNIIDKAKREDKRTLSESTEGEDIFSDSSMNEEDILQHLENIDIPIEDPKSEENGRVDEHPLVIKLEHTGNGENESVNVSLNKSVRRESSQHQNGNMNEEYELNGIHEKEFDKNGLKSSEDKCNIRRVVVQNLNTSVKVSKNDQNSVDAKNSLVDNDNSVKRLVTKNVSITRTDLNIGRIIDKSVRRIKKKTNFTGLIKVRDDLIKSEFNVKKIPINLPPLKRRPFLKSDTIKIKKRPALNSGKIKMDSSKLNIDSISDANIRFISDEESIDDTCTDKKDLRVNLNEIAVKNELPKKLITDLTEYITVYKIMSNDDKKTHDNDKFVVTKQYDNAVAGKLKNFFKKCKGNKRLKKVNSTKVEDDIKKINNSDEKELDEQNRLKGCDFCIVKTEQGETDFSCDKCNMAPIFTCDLCNFRSNTKEVILKHVSRCNKVNRAVVMC